MDGIINSLIKNKAKLFGQLILEKVSTLFKVTVSCGFRRKSHHGLIHTALDTRKEKVEAMKPQNPDAFFQLAQLEDNQIQLAEGALLIARDVYPHLKIDVYLRQLDQMAAELRKRIPEKADSSEQINHLNHYLFEEQGFKGNRDDYYNPRNSYLNDVLERKLGIPITLSIVYMEVGKRIGLPLVGIGFPGHFLVKHKGRYLDTFIDPYEDGQILSEERFLERLEQSFGQPVQMQSHFLLEATNKQILARVLRNLKQTYYRQKEYEKAVSAGEKIIWLEPDSAQDYRDLGYLYYQVKANGQSLHAFKEYLRLAGDAAPDREDIVKNIHTIKKQLAMWN
jgi:regulator of sirC expression with transglutaminase-like and TPR domain